MARLPKILQVLHVTFNVKSFPANLYEVTCSNNIHVSDSASGNWGCPNRELTRFGALASLATLAPSLLCHPPKRGTVVPTQKQQTRPPFVTTTTFQP